MTGKQTSLIFHYGISREQACMLCHLSAECSGCCAKCDHPNGCNGQTCSQPMRNNEGQRWDAWMHILTFPNMSRLVKYIPDGLRKKYGINKLVRNSKKNEL